MSRKKKQDTTIETNGVENEDPKTNPGEETIEANESAAGTSDTDPETSNDSGGSEQKPPPDPADFTPEQLREINEKADKAQEYWDKYLRLNAEFENFKKRAARDRQEAIRYANMAILEQLLPTMDNFDMALAAVDQGENVSLEAIKTGVKMVHAQFKNVLAESGLEEINAVDQPFDPSWHDAVSQMESKEVPEGHIIQQVRKGYKLRDRLIRPASVVVAKKPEAAKQDEESQEDAPESNAG